MGTGVTYTDQQILNGLRKHMLVNKLSKYSFFKPMTWEGVRKRMAKDALFRAKVEAIVNEHNAIWEQMGVKALLDGDEAFNVPLFKMYAGSKKSFQSYETNELEERIQAIEEQTK